MAVYGLVCSCGGAENLVRRCFKRAGLSDWLSIPVYKGKENAPKFLDNFETPTEEILAIIKYAQEHNPYAIVVGIDDSSVQWVDVKHGGLKEMYDAELIAERFA